MTTRPDLVDLRSLTARWRVRRDTEGLPVIPGRRGSVSAHDRTTLCVYVIGRGVLPKLLRELPAGWRRHQVGDQEANLLCPAGDLDRAAQIVRAYRRRKPVGAAAVAMARKARESTVAGHFGAENTPLSTGAMVRGPEPAGEPVGTA